MEEWTILEILQAGGFIAIMLAVVGVPQLLSSYFDLRARRLDRLENEANAERRHREMLEERREERHRDEERRRQEEERRRHDSELADRRHQELMAMLLAVLTNGTNQSEAQAELIRSLQQTVANLEAENDRLRRQNGDSASEA